jgi:DNA-binding transcriptional MerR regulator
MTVAKPTRYFIFALLINSFSLIAKITIIHRRGWKRFQSQADNHSELALDLGTIPRCTLIRMMQLRIGQVADEVGVSADTLRYYERLGLLPYVARTDGGYRQYPVTTVERVRFIRNALRFGFGLKEVAAFLRASESGQAPCEQVLAAGQVILTRVDGQIRELQAARRAIRQTLAAWNKRLSNTPAGKPARLLHTLRENQIPTDCVSARLKKR